tara:strand:- start:14515 stop:14997 length:483 start_codon:yes stop_codon:yes gene_type:complete
MPQKKRYRTPFEHERIEYSVIVTRFSDTQFEPLIPGQNREKVLLDQLKNGAIKSYSIVSGVCWAEYQDIDGYTIHKVLTYEDLTDYREPFILQTRTQDDGTCRQDWHCNSLLNRLRLKRDQKRIPGLAVRFGPRVPKDYYGNYDYDPLGGYGPDVAFYGD